MCMNSPTFCEIRLRSPVKVNWSFGGSCRLRLQRRLCMLPASSRFLVWLTIRHWRWKRHVPPKRLLTFKGLQYVTSQKTEIFYPSLWEPLIPHLHMHIFKPRTCVIVSNLWLLWLFFNFVGCGENGSTWYVSHYWAYCTSRRWQMCIKQLGEQEFAGETEVLAENLSQCYCVYHKSHMTWERTRAATVGSQ
jgi:hypothetical protein